MESETTHIFDCGYAIVENDKPGSCIEGNCFVKADTVHEAIEKLTEELAEQYDVFKSEVEVYPVIQIE